ncbi:transcriptional repressor NrdR [Fontimonas thermophila]|uniref:Transcriptional repressor NrdR n=1 Tax=Fontimonas thermophila TaxID=1076937 RepID=A0A1I2IXG6_9GAMM|nr:transcriptional regulator NrdR [Fontimonas thermophila]SFF45386.1 transcriptional repressor NrdR [Fontimonas thermophila]
MQCPFCKAPDTRVVDSRLAEDGTQVRRRRECEQCGGRFTTFERAHLAMPNVIKRSGNPEPFSEDKLRRGMESALYKRPVTAEQLDHAIENIKRKLRGLAEREVPSRQLGEWVMEELRDLDHVAYVRFASIYRAFSDVNAFREEIERLQTLPTPEERRLQLPLIEELDIARDTPAGGRKG